jgi:hypothetical protein
MTPQHFDTLIVGCGTAGAILAARLSEDDARSVGVIEAGRDYRSIEALPAGVRSHRSARGLVTSLNDPSVLGFPDWGLTARSTFRGPVACAVEIPEGLIEADEIILSAGAVGSRNGTSCRLIMHFAGDRDDQIAGLRIVASHAISRWRRPVRTPSASGPRRRRANP